MYATAELFCEQFEKKRRRERIEEEKRISPEPDKKERKIMKGNLFCFLNGSQMYRRELFKLSSKVSL